KREDLCHTGAHKLNNAVGQALLALRMGKKRVIAETGAGQHGVATATVCARFGLDCTVYMGTEDMRRQSMNVRRMKLLGAEVVEAAGKGIRPGEHAASLVGGRPGVLHGTYSYVLQDSDGQILPTHSISAGLDYPGVGPEHSFLRETERVEYVAVTDKDALAAFKLCTRLEGIMPALEPSHAIHHAGVIARELGPGGRIVVCLSGRGDKDMDSVDGG